MNKKILYREEGPVGHIILNNPAKLNSFDLVAIKELDSILGRIRKSKVKAVIITGQGKAFSSGGDIAWERDLCSMPRKEAMRQILFVQKVFSKIEGMPQAFIALIDGYAVGGGNELAMACDIRIATEFARFVHPEASLGTVAPLGATKRLPRLIGMGRAKYLLFTGEKIDGVTALKWGLVDFLVPRKKLSRFTGSLLQKIAKNPANALSLTKKSVNTPYRKDLVDRFEASSYLKCSASKENREMLDRFLRKKS